MPENSSLTTESTSSGAMIVSKGAHRVVRPNGMISERHEGHKMTDQNRGLPVTTSRAEQVFPTFTPAQIRRVAAHGHVRAIQRGEVLVEPGDSAVPFYVVVSGELETVRPLGAAETLVTVNGPGQFTGEVNTLS